jgi:REP element-mobilizing transposase RayT
MSESDPLHHHRRSIRLKGYDYTQPGAYFVTMNSQNREPLFGSIANGKMKLSQAGEIVLIVWRKLPAAHPVQLDEVVIMPEHFHGIIWIIGESKGEAFGNKSPEVIESLSPNASPQRPRGTQPNSLNAIIQNFKSVSTRKINAALKTPGDKIWQRDYYERIIRNERELNAIRQYIRDNPSRRE